MRKRIKRIRDLLRHLIIKNVLAVVKTTLLTIAIVLSGAFLVVFSITGCSDAPYAGSMLTPDDIDKYFFQPDTTTLCLTNGFDEKCLTLVPKGRDPRLPIIYIYPKKVIYIFYHQGIPVIRAERPRDDVDIEQGGGEEQIGTGGNNIGTDGGNNGGIDGVNNGGNTDGNNVGNNVGNNGGVPPTPPPPRDEVTPVDRGNTDGNNGVNDNNGGNNNNDNNDGNNNNDNNGGNNNNDNNGGNNNNDNNDGNDNNNDNGGNNNNNNDNGGNNNNDNGDNNNNGGNNNNDNGGNNNNNNDNGGNNNNNNDNDNGDNNNNDNGDNNDNGGNNNNNDNNNNDNGGNNNGGNNNGENNNGGNNNGENNNGGNNDGNNNGNNNGGNYNDDTPPPQPPPPGNNPNPSGHNPPDNVESHYVYNANNEIGDGWIVWVYYPHNYVKDDNNDGVEDNPREDIDHPTGCGFTLSVSGGTRTNFAQTSGGCTDDDNNNRDDYNDVPCSDTGSNYSAQFFVASTAIKITLTIGWTAGMYNGQTQTFHIMKEISMKNWDEAGYDKGHTNQDGW